MLDFKGNILITGASSGIGAAMSKQLATVARTLILVARRTERLVELSALCKAKNPSLEVFVFSCDLGDPQAVRELLEELKIRSIHVNILINNAGMGDIGLFESIESAKLESMLMLNVVGLSLLAHGLLPSMVKKNEGGILNVSSGFGLTWMPTFGAYVGTKHYVSSFTECLRSELSGTGVIISQLCPGPVSTEFEDIAGNPFGISVPSWIELSAAECAEIALKKFRKGRAIIIPGHMAWLSIQMGRLSPAWVLRILYGIFSRSVRPRLMQQR